MHVHVLVRLILVCTAQLQNGSHVNKLCTSSSISSYGTANSFYVVSFASKYEHLYTLSSFVKMK